MYGEDDYFSSLLNSYTTTENETEQQQSFDDFNNVQQTNPYQQNSPYVDDYSTSQNFEEETSYNSLGANRFEETTSQTIRQMDAPEVKKQAPAVNLIKKRERIYISSRLKIASVFFSIIFAALIFVSVWNFAVAGVMQSTFANKSTEINQLEQSIGDLKQRISEIEFEYNQIGDTDVNFSGYEKKEDGVNSFVFSLDDFHVEQEIEKLPSNWFNDVCEFFSQLFA